MTQVIRAFWTGDNRMSSERQGALQSMKDNLGAPIEFLGPEEIEALPARTGEPIHPAYRYLSGNHRSDYLRCYVSRFLGGGYADVKFYSKDNNWRECLEQMAADPDIWVIGAPEIVGGSPFRDFNSPPILDRLVCNSFFIVRENTDFSRHWYAQVTDILDANLERLARNPARSPRNPREHLETGYPLKWADVQGRPFHLLMAGMYHPRHFLRTLRTGFEKDRRYL